MIGHCVNNLSRASEDAVLTEPMLPLYDGNHHYMRGPCLLMVASIRGIYTTLNVWRGRFAGHFEEIAVGRYYDALCHRFGAPRVNAAIRNRILSNRARRILAGTRETAGVGSGNVSP